MDLATRCKLLKIAKMVEHHCVKSKTVNSAQALYHANMARHFLNKASELVKSSRRTTK
jgi:hypothetical protein